MTNSIPMISEQTSQMIKIKLDNIPELLKDFQRFIRSEVHCGNNVQEMIDQFTKITIGGIGIPMNEDEPGTMSEEDFMLHDNGMSIDDAMVIADRYMNVSMLMIQIFSAGMAYGRAKFDDSFLQSFDGNLVDRAIDDIC